jgi:hypothetical protein
VAVNWSVFPAATLDNGAVTAIDVRVGAEEASPFEAKPPLLHPQAASPRATKMNPMKSFPRKDTSPWVGLKAFFSRQLLQSNRPESAKGRLAAQIDERIVLRISNCVNTINKFGGNESFELDFPF